MHCGLQAPAASSPALYGTDGGTPRQLQPWRRAAPLSVTDGHWDATPGDADATAQRLEGLRVGSCHGHGIGSVTETRGYLAPLLLPVSCSGPPAASQAVGPHGRSHDGMVIVNFMPVGPLEYYT